jgi:hypothetical protein
MDCVDMCVGDVRSRLVCTSDRRGSLTGQFADHPARLQQLATLLQIGALVIPLFALTQVLRCCTQAHKTMVPSVIVGNIIQPTARFVLGVGFCSSVAESPALSRRMSPPLASLSSPEPGSSGACSHQRCAPPNAHLGPMARFALLQGGSSLLGVQTLGLAVLVLGVWAQIS